MKFKKQPRKYSHKGKTLLDFCVRAMFCLKWSVWWLGSRLWSSEGLFCVAPQLSLCSMGLLLCSCFSEERAELQNVLWGLWSCLAWAVFSMCQPWSEKCVGAEQEAVSSSKMEDGGLLLLLKALIIIINKALKVLEWTLLN